MVILGLLIAFVLWSSSSWLGVDAYVAQVKQSRTEAPQIELTGGTTNKPRMTETELRERIRREAAARYVAPVDARIDRVWKAIPGYNGLEVDQARTLKLALAHQTGPDDPLPFVYNELPPQINLADLPAQPVYKGNPNKPMAALMINVAWGEEYLPDILNTLLNENVHATFFFDGSWLAQHEELGKQIATYGHELSNHAYSHPAMSRLSRSLAQSEIRKTQSLLEDRLGVRNTLFAPPSGDFDDETLQIAQEQGLTTVLWTLDTLDWKKPEPAVILRRVVPKLEPGALILMHPTASTRDALPDLIRAIKQKGLALGTVSELLSTKRLPSLEWQGDLPLAAAESFLTSSP
jgi:probable sporulation protein (polysaccharide deacetylase family)